MSAVLENLFAQAGVGAQLVDEPTSLPKEVDNPGAAPSTAPAAAVAFHPASWLQEAYVRTILIYQDLLQAVARADSIGSKIGYSCGWRDSSVNFYAIHRDAVHTLVTQFKAQAMKGEAQLDPQREFEAAFGEQLAEEIYESGRYHRSYRDEERASPENIRLDLLKLWDALAVKYADGGMRLARSQAAAVILSDWPLRRQPFQIVNGKAAIEDRVWSEMRFGSGSRRLSYTSSETVFKLLKALNVFLDFADLEGDAVHAFFGSGRTHDADITSGRKYVVAKGHVEFKTFNEYWRWTLSEGAANKLREFLVEYGPPPSD